MHVIYHDRPVNVKIYLRISSKPKLTHKDSADDIIRASGGAYKGLASEY